MKRFVTALCLSLICAALFAQVEYKVLYANSSSLIMDNKTGDYIPLTVSTIVAANDRIYVPKRSNLHLVELTTGKPQVYKNCSVGYMTVSEMVVECYKQNKNLPKQIISNAASELVKQSSGARWSSIGAANRKDYNTLGLASQLRRLLLSPKKLKTDKSLQLVKHSDKKVFYPEFINNSNDTLYVNFVAVNKTDNTIAICFNVIEDEESLEIKLSPHSSFSLPEFYYLDSNKYQYYIFGTQSSFNAFNLSKELLVEDVSTQPNDEVIHVKYGISKRSLL